ncbi:MAG: hypothetical protein RLZZ511_1141 [Cyanobacteriota bacterium]
MSLVAQDMDKELPIVPPAPMLPNVNALPGTQD